MTHHFSLIKVHMKVNKFLTEIYNRKCLLVHLFIIWKSLGIPCTIFKCHPGYFMAGAMKNPHRLF